MANRVQDWKDGTKAGLTGKKVGDVKAERRSRERRESLEGLFAQAALSTFRQYDAKMQGQVGKNEVQYDDGDVIVKVKSGYSSDHGCVVTDIKVFDRNPRVKDHLHILFDPHGNEVYRSWNPDHSKRR